MKCTLMKKNLQSTVAGQNVGGKRLLEGGGQSSVTEHLPSRGQDSTLGTEKTTRQKPGPWASEAQRAKAPATQA